MVGGALLNPRGTKLRSLELFGNLGDIGLGSDPLNEATIYYWRSTFAVVSSGGQYGRLPPNDPTFAIAT